ncbi:hypothetical protein EV363DRAFT_747565 [Boletus edulis]|nr:hypothetical protein EV363DRAFT_747565 [Boletus edulis]
MSCTPNPTATLYATITSFFPSTSYSQGTASNVQLTTAVQQSCLASGTISGSSIGCVSSTQVTEVNTVGNGGAAQVPIVVTASTIGAQPTQTLFAPCPSGGGSSSPSQTSAQSSTNSQLTTSVLVQSTPSPSTVVEASSTTLSDGSVVQTVVTVVTTPPPTSLYVPTSLASPTLQSDASQASGTNVTPIVGGVLGGFIGLIVVVGSLWWLCRKRRPWDDIFEKDELQNDVAWAPVVPARRMRDSSAEPRPYQYGLVGHVIPPAAAGEPLRTSQHGSVSEHSSRHSRYTSLSATPLLQNTQMGSSRPSTAGSILTVQTQPGPRVLSPSAEREPRSLSMASHSSNTRPLLESRSTMASLNNWTPNMDELAVLEPRNRAGSPISPTERHVLQIINDSPPSPTDTAIPDERRTSSGASPDVIMHTDGGPVLEGSLTGPDTHPPAYSR